MINFQIRTTILEGTWEEIAQHAGEFAGRRLKVMIIEDEPEHQPNRKGFEAIRRVKEIQRDMSEKNGTDSLEMLRRGRAGEMFDYESDN